LHSLAASQFESNRSQRFLRKAVQQVFSSFRLATKNAGAGMPFSIRSQSKTDLYPADADATKEISEALKSAATDHKRVLLVFGANWCYDCHVSTARSTMARRERSSAKVLCGPRDIGEANKNLDLAKQYRSLEKGVPAVAILGSDGKLLYGSRDGEFEAARKMMKKDLVAFLNRWVAEDVRRSESSDMNPTRARVHQIAGPKRRLSAIASTFRQAMPKSCSSHPLRSHSKASSFSPNPM